MNTEAKLRFANTSDNATKSSSVIRKQLNTKKKQIGLEYYPLSPERFINHK